MRRRSLAKPLFFIGLAIFLLLVPVFVHNNYYLHILITIALQLILVTSLFLIFTTGQMSIAHAAFMAIGAYTSALLVTRLGFNFWLALPLSGVMAGIIAVLIGYPTLRLAGVYFFLVTFAFGEALVLAIGHLFEGTFGGLVGISGIPMPNSISIPGLPAINFAAGRVPHYYLAIILMLVSLVIIYRVYRSRIGMTFRAIASTSILAEHMGVNALGYKILAFAIGCFFAGLVGSFHAHYHYVIVPIDFTFEQSLHTIILMVVGGMGSFAGPVVGVPVLTFAYELLNAYPYYREILFGVVLLGVMLFMRGGLVAMPQRLSPLVQKLLELRVRRKAITS